ncbi:hypothetical protein AK812_SmicGene4741 [Symbiodinium microadriaticum]|uniref:Uncharacterized protein n=1 Tax=Symbiodinium microadriaticum TaxID=2951 RepID=A0A1Q9EVD1_SYMMI|nr:hypothetical protein AK812_SmicGene4741 [Symbiodinium microadriaticum]
MNLTTKIGVQVAFFDEFQGSKREVHTFAVEGREPQLRRHFAHEPKAFVAEKRLRAVDRLPFNFSVQAAAS